MGVGCAVTGATNQRGTACQADPSPPSPRQRRSFADYEGVGVAGTESNHDDDGGLRTGGVVQSTAARSVEDNVWVGALGCTTTRMMAEGCEVGGGPSELDPPLPMEGWGREGGPLQPDPTQTASQRLDPVVLAVERVDLRGTNDGIFGAVMSFFITRNGR